MHFAGEEGEATFCEQKVAKKLCYAGPWAMSSTQSQAQRNKSFCAAFFKKPPLPSGLYARLMNFS
jgi:hypothetical protein